MAVKYLILGFFIKVILVDMSPLVARSFQQSAYNKIADVKMLKFFLEISQSAIVILLALALFSLVVRNFWCRYLCPYGALLGIVALFSPWKATREAQKCTGCDLCNRPAGIYLLVVVVAQLTGHWRSSLTLADYRELIPQSRWLGH